MVSDLKSKIESLEDLSRHQASQKTRQVARYWTLARKGGGGDAAHPRVPVILSEAKDLRMRDSWHSKILRRLRGSG